MTWDQISTVNETDPAIEQRIKDLEEKLNSLTSTERPEPMESDVNESKLLRIFRGLTPEGQDVVLAFAETAFDKHALPGATIKESK